MWSSVHYRKHGSQAGLRAIVTSHGSRRVRGGPGTPTIITLTTDFGTRDAYVAQLKGVLLAGCPGATLIDLTHEIEAQDVSGGALFLAAAIPLFPEGTIHLAVVDPGVGSGRRAIALQAGGQTLVCPDNGLATLYLRERRLEVAHEIANQELLRAPISSTFHARDVFAPVAAHLACGGVLEELGPAVAELVTLDVPSARMEGGVVRGEVQHVDRFGNAITTIRSSDLVAMQRPIVHAAGRELGALRRTYADAGLGEALALVGSADYVEIAVRDGSAARQLGLRRGDPVEVREARA